MNILETLVEKKIINRSDIPLIEERSVNEGVSIEEILGKMGIDKDDIISAKADILGVPYRKISEKEITKDILGYIPEESAFYYKFIPLGVQNGVLDIGMVDPDDIEARDVLNFISSKIEMPFKIFLINQEDFDKVIEMYKGLSSEVTKALSELEGELVVQTGDSSDEDISAKAKKTESSAETRIIEEAPVTKIVATILRYATDGSASDVHIEPMGENVRVRFRVDGVLNTSLVLPHNIHSAVVARIKILSNMRLDEKRKPQDGRFSAKIENRRIDFRVSTFPTHFGEKIVMRILDKDKGVKTLDQIGLSKKNLEAIRMALGRPYGLILISGPTGSGKTTTLYSMLGEIDKDKTNVLSLEDPVEYTVAGVSQSQVRPDINYTFATGLRTTLRQDPDVIMVGEIRDRETAQLAIQAALTGHLVLSTIHTNNAIGVIPRLVNMGVDPYLIAPTLVLAMSQRLVGVLCPDGKKPIAVEGSIKMMIEKQFEDLPQKYRSDIPSARYVYEPSPTADCPNGVRGRLAVMEVLEMSKELERIILTNPVEQEVYKVARSQGMLSMKEDALIKALNGEIPFREVNAL